MQFGDVGYECTVGSKIHISKTLPFFIETGK